MSAPKPNVFIIGAMKSATTYLSELLRAHPQIFMSSPKEPCYFVDHKLLRTVYPEAWQNGYWRSLDRYLSLFAGAGRARVIVEASTPYSKAPMFDGVPQHILDFNPEARFIYIMRDPIERTISHYWHRVRYWGEYHPMLEALQSDPHYMDVSYYAMQLKRYFAHVTAERVYTMTYEELLAEPQGQLRRLFTWLGVDPSVCPANIGMRVNALTPMVQQKTRGWSFISGTRMYLRMRLWIPSPLRAVRAPLMYRALRPQDVSTDEVKAFLRPIQQRQTEELVRLLGREFPQWLLF